MGQHLSMRATAVKRQNPKSRAPDAAAQSIATKLRALRRQRGMSINALATRAGVSVGIISQIERGNSNPSMRTLQRIRGALGVTLWDFLDPPAPGKHSEDPPFVRRAADRLKISVGSGKLIKELMSPQNDEGLRFMLISLPPQAETEEVLIGEGEKGGFVLSGEVELDVAGRQARLREGDSFQFQSHQPHRLANPTDSPAQVLWIMSFVGLHL
jgi:transcriptional regulator with XRE-family HTH domain